VIKDLLRLTDVQVVRRTRVMDGKGGISTTTTTVTTLDRAALWQLGSSKIPVADKIAAVSTHILALETVSYNWASSDEEVRRGSAVYRVSGLPDDVFASGELTVVPLERTV